jgi:uncharacterized protein YjdB
MRIRTPIFLIVALAIALNAATCTHPQDVIPAVLAEVRVDSAAVVLRVGDSIQVGARVLDQHGAVVAASINWLSRQPAVATVAATGMIRAANVGHAYVVASAGSDAIRVVSDSLFVTVVPFMSEASFVAISPVAATVGVGDTIVFVASSGGTSRGPFIWTSEDSSIVHLRAPVILGSGTERVVGETRGSGTTTVTVRAETTGRFARSDVIVQ